MTSIYLCDEENKMLLLYRLGSRVVKNSYTGTAGGHFEKDELNDAKKCVLRELKEETGLITEDIEELELKYVIDHYLKEGRKKNRLYGGIATPTGVEFVELNEF